jgi:hypothetical protein
MFVNAVQLLKLGCAHLIRTPFYLITDADTFYLNPFSAGEAPLKLSELQMIHDLMQVLYALFPQYTGLELSLQTIRLASCTLYAGDLFHTSACNSTEQHIVCNAQRSEAYRCTPDSAIPAIVH